MRLRQLASASTLVLLVLPVVVSAAASASVPGPSLGWVTPTEGAHVEPVSNVTLVYHHAASSAGVAGEAAIDGRRVGTFVGNMSGNETWITFSIDASAIPLGGHTMTASAWTASDAAVDAPSIDIVLVAPDARPVVASLAGAYVNDTTSAFVVTGHVDDPDGPTLNLEVVLPGIGSASLAGAPADFTLSVPGQRPPGTVVNATLLFDDGIKGGSATVRIVVPDVPPTIAVTTAEHLLGGRLHVAGVVSDPDGYVFTVAMSTPYGFAQTFPKNGTFDMTLVGMLDAGDVPISLRAVDNHRASSFANETIHVAPVHGEALHDAWSLGVGATVDASRTDLVVPEVRNGTLALEGDGAIAGGFTVETNTQTTAMTTEPGSRTEIRDLLVAPQTFFTLRGGFAGSGDAELTLVGDLY